MTRNAFPNPRKLARTYAAHARYSLPPPTHPATIDVTLPRPSVDVPLALVAGMFGALAGIAVTTMIAVLS